MKNTMKKFIGVIMILAIMMGIGCTANAVYNEEENTIDYEFVMYLAALGMKPDVKVEADDSGMIWTRTCEISDLVKTAEDLGGDCDLSGDGTVYMWYSMTENIGTVTIVGDFTYYWADDEEAHWNYYQMIFHCDEDGEMYAVTEDFDEIYW